MRINVVKKGNKLTVIDCEDFLAVENGKLLVTERFLSLRPSFAITFQQIFRDFFDFEYKNNPNRIVLIEPAEVQQEGDYFIVTKKGKIKLT